MGFPEALSKKALIKVKNESMAAAVEAVVALQEAELAQKATEGTPEVRIATVVEWPCPACTIINKPGKTVCDMCGAAAPAHAYVDAAAEKAKKEAEEREKKEEEERIARGKKAEEERRQAAELKRIEEEKYKEKVRLEFEATKLFLA
jgi:uncharacterized Zn finger protein (UPF0148 family)